MGAVNANQIVRRDQTSGRDVDAAHQVFAGNDNAISNAADRGRGRANGLRKVPHRRVLRSQEVIEFHDFHSYVFRK